MVLGRSRLPDDEQSILVQNARKVQLADEVTVMCATTDDAVALRDHLGQLGGGALVEASLGDHLTVWVRPGDEEVVRRVIDSLRDEIRGKQATIDELSEETPAEAPAEAPAKPAAKRAPRKTQA